MADLWRAFGATTTTTRPGVRSDDITAKPRSRRNVYGVAVTSGKSSISIIVDVKHLSWQARAACRDMDREAFFEDTPGQAARAACATCPVRQPCDDYADQNRLEGLWGGRTKYERFRAKERARKARPAAARKAVG